MKYLKKIQEQSTTGSQAKTCKKYIYCEQMAFLRKNTSKNVTISSMHDDVDKEPVAVTLDEDNRNVVAQETDIMTQPISKKPERAGPKYTEVEKTIMRHLSEPEDRHLNFFKGILPSLQLLKEEEVIRFQSSVLNILQDIHKSRQHSAASPYYGSSFQQWNITTLHHQIIIKDILNPQISANSHKLNFQGRRCLLHQARITMKIRKLNPTYTHPLGQIYQQEQIFLMSLLATNKVYFFI